MDLETFFGSFKCTFDCLILHKPYKIKHLTMLLTVQREKKHVSYKLLQRISAKQVVLAEGYHSLHLFVFVSTV